MSNRPHDRFFNIKFCAKSVCKTRSSPEHVLATAGQFPLEIVLCTTKFVYTENNKL